jgi:hypothetical protein
MAYKMDMQSLPEVLFKCIFAQLRTVFESTDITRSANIKELLDKKFNSTESGIV